MATNRKIITILIITIFMVVLFIIFLEPINYKPEKDFEVTYLNLSTTSDTKTLFNIDFEYVINNNVCDNTSQLQGVILVTSYFGNVETRSAMRRAFPSAKLKEFNLRRVFLLGISPDDKYTTQKAILHENKRFGDLIQGNFQEAYRNLTYKHVMGLKWSANYCKNSRYIIKMDDDIVVNMYKIIELMNKTKLPSRKLLAGYILSGMTPIREPANKWYVTKEEYEGSFYPTFVSGWFYITNPKTCKKIVEMSSRVPYFWVDDIYVTGIIAQRLRIKHYSLKEYFTVHPEFLQCCMRDTEKSRYDCEFYVGPNGGDNNLFFTFNEIMTVCYHERCYKREKPLNETCVAEKKFSLGKGNAVVETYKLA